MSKNSATQVYDPIMLVGQLYSNLSFVIDLCDKLDECGHGDAFPDDLRQALKSIQPPVVGTTRFVGADGTDGTATPSS